MQIAGTKLENGELSRIEFKPEAIEEEAFLSELLSVYESETSATIMIQRPSLNRNFGYRVKFEEFWSVQWRDSSDTRMWTTFIAVKANGVISRVQAEMFKSWVGRQFEEVLSDLEVESPGEVTKKTVDWVD